MIIPLGHEEQLARRWPWVSIAIIVLSFLGWAFLRTPMAEGELRVAQAQSGARAFAQVHSYTNPGPCRALTDTKLMGGGGFSANNDFLADFPNPRSPGAASGAQAEGSGADQEAAAQAELTRLCRVYDQELSESLKHRLGYVPGRSGWLSLISYQFVDDSFLHLIFGMWFLWLAGAVIEDGWGRVLYPLFYISGGICAAIFYKLAEPHSPVPLLGASGGVAAAVGAFLVRHPKAESKMLVWFRLRPRVISAPAFVMVGLWLGIELIGAMFLSLVESNAAAWAQFVGFGFGMAFAAGMRWTGAEKRLDDAIEQRSLEPSDPRLEQARRLIAEGQLDAAVTRLHALTAEEPFSIDVQRVVVEAAQAKADVPQLSAARARLIDLYQRKGEHEAAWQVYDTLSQNGHGHAASPRARLRVAEHLGKTEREARAMQEFAALYAGGFNNQEAAEGLVGHAELMLQLRQREEARALFEIAQRELGGYPRLAGRISAGLSAASVSSLYAGSAQLAPADLTSAHAAPRTTAAGPRHSPRAGDVPASLRDLPNPIKKP